MKDCSVFRCLVLWGRKHGARQGSRTQPGGSSYWQAVPVPGERTPGLSTWSKSQKLAVVLHFRDPRQKSQLWTTSCKCKATNTDLISGLDHGHYTGLQSPRPWIPVGNTAVSQWKGEVILPTPFQACLCPEDACQFAYHIVLMTVHPGSVPTPKMASLSRGPYWATTVGSTLWMDWDQNGKQPYCKLSLYPT